MAADRPDLDKYVGRELTVIAWLWARTVASPNPAARGAHVPLARSFWLSKKKGKLAWVEPVVDRAAGTYRFEVRVGTPTAEQEAAADAGTVTRRGGTCLLTGDAMPFKFIRQRGKQVGLGERLMAVALEGDRERVYLGPLAEHAKVASSAAPEWTPDVALPPNARDFKTPNYGMISFADLFTKRQLVALDCLSALAAEARIRVAEDVLAMGDAAYAESYGSAVSMYLAMLVSRQSNYCSTICVWSSHRKDELVKQVFMRQAVPMTWDYGEVNIFASTGGSFETQYEWLSKAIKSAPGVLPGRARNVKAQSHQNHIKYTICSDPPYYDNIIYSDLSDYFFVWLKRAFDGSSPLFDRLALTPKKEEVVAIPYRHDDDKEKAMQYFRTEFLECLRVIHGEDARSAPVTIFYAFKQQEGRGAGSKLASSTGWETMLQAAFEAGFTTYGTWPVSTESVEALKNRMNALASSIVLVCRPRPADAPTATRREFKRLLDAELPDALAHLRAGGIAPVDLAQAAIGPGMAVFTRHAKVLESDGAAMTVRTALGLINEVLDASLAEAEGDFDRDTRWAVAWFEQHGPAEGPYGDAETLSNAKNTSVDGLVRAGVITSRAGKVRLVPRPQLPEDWSPATDDRLTVWEACQHLIRRLEADGEQSAAALLAELGPDADKARDLAYRLYSLSERKKLSAEGRAYNGLITAWPELSKLAREVRRERQTQGSLLGD